MDKTISACNRVDIDSLVEQIMHNNPLILKISNRKIYIAFLPVIFAFFFFGILWLYVEYPLAWLIFLFPFFLLLLVRYALSSNTFTLTSEGFTITSRFGSKSYDWREIEEFKASWTYSTRTIMYKASSFYESTSSMEKIVRSFSFDLYTLFDFYSMKTEDLANLMNKLRERATDQYSQIS